MHGAGGSGHCEGAGDASQRASEQAVRNHTHLTSDATPPFTQIPEGSLGGASMANDRKELWFRATYREGFNRMRQGPLRSTAASQRAADAELSPARAGFQLGTSLRGDF